MPLAQAIVRRSSGRDFGPRALTAEQLATLLYLGNGVQPAAEDGAGFKPRGRNAANAGGLGSVEIFPIVLNVADVTPGVYHFDSVRHDLARLHSGAFGTWLRERVLHQVEFAGAAVALVLTSAFGRLRAKYGERCLRFGFLDAGHVSENIYLVGTGLGLPVCATAGFVDAELDETLGLDGLEVAPVLILLAGTSG
jgi:SagB-type dehydrogenase family enzyme